MYGAEILQTPETFVANAFNGSPPAPQRLWLDKTQRRAIRAILERELGMLRVRYWRRDTRTAWILEEIGKELPITTGLLVEGQALADVRVLVYRESRGWEVKYPAFTDQFIGLRLQSNHQLSGPIDGISGATLSVRALTKLARLALLLDSYVQQSPP
ncbi:MAG: FMN-binding protein [Gammaproteobacteria bacterium]|nr:FMN-binding protein [Gammaproteobacteria bacterium]